MYDISKQVCDTDSSFSIDIALGSSFFLTFTAKTDMIYSVIKYSVEFVINQDPVAQSIVSLTSSLRGQLVKYFTTL